MAAMAKISIITVSNGDVPFYMLRFC
jgi:hypothetical protein